MALCALVGGTIYVDPHHVIPDGVLLTDGGIIRAAGPHSSIAIPRAAKIIDCTGHTVVAGFWNCHVHLTERKWSDAAALPREELSAQFTDFTRYGFTTIFDLSSLYENTMAIARRVEHGDVHGPRILTTGPGIIPAGGAPPAAVSRMMGWMDVPLPEGADAASAIAAAQTLFERGVDGLKMFLSGAPSTGAAVFNDDAIRAVVKAAHARVKPVFVHPNTEDDWLRAINGGADVIAHTVPNTRAFEAPLASMKQRGMALIPTLMLWKRLMRHDRISLQQCMVESAVAQLRAFNDIGGEILFGTDYGAVDANPADEYALMQQAGLTVADILQALTTAPARRFGSGLSDGTLAPSRPADVAVLRGRPADGPSFFSDVLFTLRAGRLIYSTTQAIRPAR